MKIEIGDLISVSEASNRGVSKLVSEASEGRQFVVLRNNKPMAVIAGVDLLEHLQRLEELQEDMKLFAIALARATTDTGERISLADAAASFGIDLDELADDED